LNQLRAAGLRHHEPGQQREDGAGGKEAERGELGERSGSAGESQE
jgi:hypothetical protein